MMVDCLFCGVGLKSKQQKKFCSKDHASKYYQSIKKARKCLKCEKVLRSKWNQHLEKCGGELIECDLPLKVEKYKCKGCDQEFTPTTKFRKTYCSDNCEMINRNRFATEMAKNNRKLAGQMAQKRNGSGYKPGSGRGKSGWFKGIWCDSSWELAFVIYHVDNSINIERNKDKFYYDYNGKISYYLPDFRVNGELYEIKGYMTTRDELKHQACNEKLILIDKNKIEPYLKYAIMKYGKKFIHLYE